MAARKSPGPRAAYVTANGQAAGLVRVGAALAIETVLRESQDKVAGLTAALEAEHKLAGEIGVSKAAIEEAFAAYRRDAEARYAALQDDSGALTLSLSDVANELEALKDDSKAEIKRLRRELIEAAGDVAMHRERGVRATAALTAFALRYGDLAAEMFEREDDEALTAGRHEARNG